MIRKREREREWVSPAASRHAPHRDIRKRDKSNFTRKGKNEKRNIYRVEKKIFSIMRHHQPGVIISWTFISRQDNKCPVAQLFLTNLPIVFHPPPEHRLPVFNVFPSFPALPRFLSFFPFSFPSLLFSLTSFSLAFERNKGGGRWRWYV